MKALFTGIAISVALSACSSMISPPGTMAPVVSPNRPGTAGSGTGANTGSGNPVGSNGISVSDASRNVGARSPTVSANADADAQNAKRMIETLAGKSIYFDYNQFTVKAEYVDMLRQDFATAKARGSAPLKLEGNADERGSREYNLALGQKRAEAVKKQLELLGVPETQLEAVSFGSEKPRETCHEEKCWAENRRVDLMREGR